MLLTSTLPMRQAREIPSSCPLVILDARVDDLNQLVEDLGSADVLVLDPTTDGIEQITAALHARQSVSSLHLVFHGAPGEVQIGKTRLNLETLERYAKSLQTWGEILRGGSRHFALRMPGCRGCPGLPLPRSSCTSSQGQTWPPQKSLLVA